MNPSEYAKQFIGKPYEWGTFSWCEAYVQACLEYYGMTEKKTFNITTKDQLYLDFSGLGDYILDGVGPWRLSEWDMEVTFTKKAVPLKVGDRLSTDLRFNPQTVIGVWKDKVWLEDCDGDDEVYWLGDFEYKILDSTDS